MDTTSINLLRTQSVLSQEEVLFLSKLRFAGVAVLVGVVCLGLFVGAAYAAGKLQYNQLESKKTQLSQSITSQAKKQILLLSLQDRLPIIQKTLDSQYPWDRVVENVVAIVGPPFLKTFTIGQNNVLNITAQTKSLEDVQTMITEAIKQTQEKKIRSPQITTMSVARDGGIDITFTFIPIL